MHEYSIVQSLIERIDRELAANNGTHVHRVEVAIGELAGVEVELLKTAFETFREGTSCANATIEVHSIAASYRCFFCDRPIARKSVLQCPECKRPARLESGDEILLERVEMEVA